MQTLNEVIISKYSQETILLGQGSLESDIMLIGEAPGSKEIEFMAPFVGQSGKHLNEFLRILNIDREDLYITNAVKYRPTKTNAKTGRLSNRTPTLKEISSFRQLLYEEIHILDPKIIVTLGNTPLRSIFDKDLKIGKVHGELMKVDIKDKKYKIFPLYHPAAVIYRRELKPIYIEDLELLKNIISEND